MTKCIINTFPASSEPGSQETHYGLVCTVGEKRELITNVPEEFLDDYLAAGRVTVIQGEDKEDLFTGMDRDAQKAYLTTHEVTFPANIPAVALLALCRKTSEGLV